MVKKQEYVQALLGSTNILPLEMCEKIVFFIHTYKFKNREELKHAVNNYPNNIDKYGNISDWDVSSITDNGTGDYTITFTTAMTDANYAVIGNCMMGDNLGVSESFGVKGNASSGSMTAPALQSTTAVRLLDQDADGSDRDNPNLYVAVFR